MTDTLLSARGVCFDIKGKPVLHDISLDIQAGEITTLIGPNGAGKTSLVKLLLGLGSPTSGEVVRQPGIRTAYVPQRVSIPQELPLRVRDFLMLTPAVGHDDVHAVLREVGIEDVCDTAIQSVSGGELQRVLIARALLKRPQLLVLDEPAQGLDMVGQQALYQTVTDIRDRYHCAVLMVSHDLHLVMAATDRVVCVNTHVCCTGHPDDVSAHPEYIKLFGPALNGLAIYSHHHDHEHDVHGNIISEDHGHGDHTGCSHD